MMDQQPHIEQPPEVALAPYESPRLSRYDTALQPVGGDAFRGAPMTELLVALGLIAGVVAAHEIGFRLGSLTRSDDEPFDRQVALVRTSTAALVAFLIGFAFSGAASRFIDRLDIIVKEANALGTAYLRADTIAEPTRRIEGRAERVHCRSRHIAETRRTQSDRAFTR
jgi:hypothetical protein